MKRRTSLQAAKTGFYSGRRHDKDSPVRRTLNVQVRICRTESEIGFVREWMLTIEYQGRRRVQIGKRYPHISIISDIGRRLHLWGGAARLACPTLPGVAGR